jgi:hypothetical protein
MLLVKKMLIAGLLLSVMTGGNKAEAIDIKSVPASITVQSGELLVRFDKRKFWTMNRIEFQNKLLGLDGKSSHYGTVFNFPGVGFIGTGHTENESEQLVALEFYVNDKQLKQLPADGKLKAGSFKLVRSSRVRGFMIINIIRIRYNRIEEDVIIEADKTATLSLIYNFMHPWVPTMSDYLAKTTNGKIVSGSFSTSKKFVIKKAIEWVAVYQASSGLGAVSKITETPDKGGAVAMLWDQAPYRKFYLKSFVKQTFRKNYKATYRMVTGFFYANRERWQKKAEKLARDI